MSETRETIMTYLADYFHVPESERNDINSYEWQAGCYNGNQWFSLAEVVYAIEHMLECEGIELEW